MANKNIPPGERYRKNFGGKAMRDKKQKHKDSQMINNVQNEELLEISQTGYGLEAVEKGMDYMEGDQDNSPNCGGL
ncbi:hypothetical protein G3A_13965 [Bacillus sp. 17376]|nr:hypothetical protein G3A_13965 [Bacillus sp. 17376]